mmetsp:Transcript_2146/g.3438  ORF Transcript_2146/g.3438 Transcript_2146/m.3438 type:complete len:119 (+) Transcript_2146:414-770(+)
MEAANSTSKKIGKFFMSHSSDSLGMVCYVPEDHSFSAKAWMEAVLEEIGGEIVGEQGSNITARCNAADGVFSLKNGKKLSQGEAVGFEATAASVAKLRQHGLFPPKEADDDDDFIPEW